MGLFSKFGGKSKAKVDKQEAHADTQETNVLKKVKSKKQKPVKTKGGKKSMFGGKKKELTLLERMQLEESVAAASLDVVQELADLGNSAVREVEEGLLIVALTNDMLEEAGLDPSSEEFGSFAEGLRSETIESIALAEDLNQGVFGIIPSQETLISLDEYDFVHEIAFRWAIVPFDLEDEDQLTILDSEVTIDRLVELANNPNIHLEIRNGEVVELGASDDAEYDSGYHQNDDGVEDVEDDFVENDVFDNNDGIIDDDEDELDAGFDAPDELDDTLDDGFGNLDDGFGDNDDVGFDEDLDEDLDVGFDDPDDMGSGFDSADPYVAVAVAEPEVELEDEISAEEAKEAINRVAQHSFNNTELELNIDMAAFDDYFDSVTIARFDTTKQDNSELQNIISKLRQDANVELQRFHQENVQSLRNKYTSSMRDIHNKLVESLDHKNKHTTYGSKFVEIENKYDDAMDNLDRYVADEIDKIQSEYNQEREEFAENARREALAIYDSRYKDGRDRKIASARDNVQSDLKTKRDVELGELYSDRRTVAKRLFDKATTALLQNLQEEYQQISQKELQMYDAFRKDMDVYLRKHFADEVLRAKAEAEKLRQSHEAERVRNEYEQMLLTKTRQLEEADERAREALRQLESTHKEQVEHIKADYQRRIEREQRDNQELREMLQDATASNSKISEQKEKEIEHRLKVYEDQLKAKERELEYANNRANDSQRPMKFIIGAVAAVTLALGIIFGFLFGAGQAQHIAPSAPENQAVEGQATSYHFDNGVTDTVYGFELNDVA